MLFRSNSYKSVSYFCNRLIKFKKEQLSDSAIEMAVCLVGLVLCSLISHGCCNKPHILSSHIIILPKCIVLLDITLTSVVSFPELVSVLIYFFPFLKKKTYAFFKCKKQTSSCSEALQVSYLTNPCGKCLTNILLTQPRECVGCR